MRVERLFLCQLPRGARFAPACYRARNLGTSITVSDLCALPVEGCIGYRKKGEPPLRSVKPGKRYLLQLVEVLAGLAEGDTVIVHPGELVRHGARVETR